MKKVLLGLFALTATLTSVKAQKDEAAALTFGAGVHVALPIGDFSNVSSFGFGAEGQAEYKFQPNISAIGTTGYSYFIGKDLGGTKISTGIIPVLVGARYYPSTTVFVGAQVGVGFMHASADGYSANATGFYYKPQVGYDGGKFQLALSYNGISKDGTTSWLGLSGIVKF